MAEARHRRLVLKRIAAWTVGVMALLAGYIAGMPFVGYVALFEYPPATPVVQVLYAPLDAYLAHPEFPGSTRYQAYCTWCYDRLLESYHTEG